MNQRDRLNKIISDILFKGVQFNPKIKSADPIADAILSAGFIHKSQAKDWVEVDEGKIHKALKKGHRDYIKGDMFGEANLIVFMMDSLIQSSIIKNKE